MTRIELVDLEGQLLREIADSAMKREDVALTYALALRNQSVNWSKVNHAIVDRWSRSALVWIKEWAWKIRESDSEALNQSVPTPESGGE